MKQTAVEWFSDEISEIIGKIPLSQEQEKKLINTLEQAKEIHKQQIIEAHFQGVKGAVLNLSEHIDIPKTLKTIKEIQNGIGKHEEGEDYYNETFKK